MSAEQPSPPNPFSDDLAVVRASTSAVRSRESPANPYAAPDVHLSELGENSLLPKTANADGLIDAWRDGDLLVVSGPGRLPECCLQCGRTTERMETLQFIPIKPQQADGGWVAGSLCPICFSLHRWGEIENEMGSCCLIGIPLFFGFCVSRLPASEGDSLLMVVAGSCLIAITIWLLSRAIQRIVRLAEVSRMGDNHWLRGAKPQFLNQLPPLPQQAAASTPFHSAGL